MPIVSEYIQRQRLAKIGITSLARDLPAWKGDAFVLISDEFDKLTEKELQKNRAKAKRR